MAVVPRVSTKHHVNILPASEGHTIAEQRISAALATGATELILSNLGLAEIPKSIVQLKSLKSLELGRNRIRELPAFLLELENLERISAADNRLILFPQWLYSHHKFTYLNLATNHIKFLPDGLSNLTKLKVLWVNQNRLKRIPEEIGALKQLTELGLWKNRLTSVPETLGELKKLKLLLLQENQLEFLPASLVTLPHLRALYLHGNPALGLPPEILGPEFFESYRRRGPSWRTGKYLYPTRPADIFRYYFRSRQGKRPLNEAKLILVGRGGVGKTCLIKRLVHGTFDVYEPETPGIEIQPWEITLADGDNVRLHVWDFGGQEILHATHQFFLTERTVYLLVLSGREGTSTQDAEYWLQLIRSFGGDSKVIIALNKSHQHPFDVNGGFLREKYPQIVEFIKTDCECAENGLPAPSGGTAWGIQELKSLIYRQTAILDHRKVDFPSDWFEIKERLAGMKENFVTWDQYQEICRDLGESDAKAQRDLANYLHILGIALNYRGDPRLRDTHVLNPRWVTEGIYSILRYGQTVQHERKGVLDTSDLTSALNPSDYPPASHYFLLTLMEKFQLCFALPRDQGRYLVPELLGENQPDAIKDLVAAEAGLGFLYKYDVLPEGLLPRFIVQTHVYSEKNPELRWRTGVVLDRNGCQAVVRADTRERRVDVHIVGPERFRRDLLAIIRERFDEQHRDLKGLHVEERVPIPGEKGVSISYSFLVLLEAEGNEWCRPENTVSRHKVGDLLNGIESRENRFNRVAQRAEMIMAKSMSKKHVFLSYCHDNAAEAAQLRQDLLAANEAVWWDQDISPGADWKFEIDQAMQDAYAVILCLSKETEARFTSGIYPEATKAIEALREYAPGNIFLIPVRFSQCNTPRIEIDATRRLDRLQHVDLFPPPNRATGLDKLTKAIQKAPHHP